MKTIPIVIVLVMTTCALAQTQPERQETKTLVYDVRGLLQSARTEQRGAMFGGGAGGDEKSRLEMVDAYIDMIQDTIASTTWRDNGGDVGAIRELNGLLIITHTEETHQQIAALLQQVNEKQARLVRVRAHWLFGTPEQLQLGDRGTAATRQIDPAVLEKLPKEVVHHRAETVCFSGQTVSLSSGSQYGYVSKLSPVVGTQSVGYDPSLDFAQDGTQLEITPAVQTDGQAAWLDLESKVSRWTKSQGLDMKQVTSSTTRPVQLGGETVIDRPNTSEQVLRTSLRVPVGTAVIVGGMTVEPGLQSPNGPQMLLVVEVFVD